MSEKDDGGKTTYQRVISGEIEPKGQQKGWLNLETGRRSFNTLDKEELTEISRKGAAAVHKLHGEKKSARQALENILSLKLTDEIAQSADIDPAILERVKRDNPDATLYDAIQAVAVGRAMSGNIKAAEYVRDTHGDAPIKEIKVDQNITTDADRALMRQIADRLADSDIVIVKDITADTVKTDTASGQELQAPT